MKTLLLIFVATLTPAFAAEPPRDHSNPAPPPAVAKADAENSGSKQAQPDAPPAAPAKKPASKPRPARPAPNYLLM